VSCGCTSRHSPWPASTRSFAAESSPLDPVALHRDTGGNPFYVTEVLAAADSVVPSSVRDAVLARANRLPADARRVLDAAAVLGPRSPLGLVLEVAGELPTAVDECTRRALLLDEQGALAFRHELARRSIEQALTPGRRTELHAAALDALRGTGERDDRRLAHHAAGSADYDAVLEHAPRAAERAARLGAHRGAGTLLPSHTRVMPSSCLR
jgi:predicted ATPase